MDNDNNKKSKITNHLKKIIWTVIPVLIFIHGAVILLAVTHKDFIYTVEQRSLWLSSTHFFAEKINHVGGLIEWAGCYLTQFFHYPLLGTTIIITLWTAIFYLTISVFSIQRQLRTLALIPGILLLCSIISVGYWIYYMNMPGYWFSQTLGTLIALSAIKAYTLFDNKAYHIAFIIITELALYPLIGWFALLTLIIIAIKEVKRAITEKDKNTFRYAAAALSLAGVAVMPVFAYRMFSNMRLVDAWTTSFPIFQHMNVVSYKLSAPFILLAVFFIIMALTENRKRKAVSELYSAICGLSVTILGTLLVVYYSFNDKNFKSELRMMICLDENNWDGILEEANKNFSSPTRQMVVCKNIALLNKGRLGFEMFKYGNGGVKPFTGDSLDVSLVNTAGPEFFYHFGHTCFSYRWCIENSVKYGLNPALLKIMIKDALLNNEFELAVKYVKKLRQTTFHKDEANHYDQILRNISLLRQEPELMSVAQMIDDRDMLDGDNGFCDLYITEYLAFSTSNVSKRADAIVAATLIARNKELFWPRFMNFGILNEGKEIPLHYQEAAYMFALEDENPLLYQIPFDKTTIVDRYNAFQQMMYSLHKNGKTVKEMAETMKPLYGDTYWWYYFLCRDIEYY